MSFCYYLLWGIWECRDSSIMCSEQQIYNLFSALEALRLIPGHNLSSWHQPELKRGPRVFRDLTALSGLVADLGPRKLCHHQRLLSTHVPPTLPCPNPWQPPNFSPFLKPAHLTILCKCHHTVHSLIGLFFSTELHSMKSYISCFGYQ